MTRNFWIDDFKSEIAYIVKSGKFLLSFLILVLGLITGTQNLAPYKKIRLYCMHAISMCHKYILKYLKNIYT